jgi:hypothetical protein
MKTMLVVAAVLLFAIPARAAWELAPGLSAGFRPGTSGGGGMGTLSVSYRASERWTFAITGAAGGYLAPADAMALVAFHARWFPESLQFPGAAPFVEAGFVHAHEIPWAEFREEPATATAGVCECIHHRTGLSVGAGVSVPLPGSLPVSLVARTAAIGLLPHAGLPGAYLEGALALAWRF